MTRKCALCGRLFDWTPKILNIFFPDFIWCGLRTCKNRNLPRLDRGRGTEAMFKNLDFYQENPEIYDKQIELAYYPLQSSPDKLVSWNPKYPEKHNKYSKTRKYEENFVAKKWRD